MTPARLEEIRELNASKKWGHPGSAVQHCAELLAEVDRLRALAPDGPPPGWKVNNPHWPAGEGEYLIPEEAEPTSKLTAVDAARSWPPDERYGPPYPRLYREPRVSVDSSRFALAETPPGSRIGQFLDLRAPTERPEGFLRHRQDISGESCLFCGAERAEWGAAPRCPATAAQLDSKAEAVRCVLVEERHAHPPDRPEIARLDALLTRLRNRRDLVALAAVPETQTRAGEDLRVPEE